MMRVGLLGVVLVGCAPMADDRSFAIDGDFDAVRVELSNGDLRLEPADGELVTVDVDFGGFGRRDGVSRTVEDGVLVVDYSCAMCGGELIVGVPAGMPASAWVAHGDLTLVGLTGPVDGDVRTGAITGEDLACDVELFTNAGAIEATWTERPTDVFAEAHLGAVELELPAGGYDLDARSNLGVVRLTDVFDDPDADAAIEAFAHAGEVAITGR